MNTAPSGIAVRVQTADFDGAAECRALTNNRLDVGALATFTGLCRGEDDRLSALELEHYPGMAEKQILAIASEAERRFGTDRILVIHRVGRIEPGEQIVLVAATSRHRDAAFDAARYVMDFLKTDAPFWKKEHPKDGSTGEWVSAADKDDAAKARWKE